MMNDLEAPEESGDVAIVGMALRFPGASNVEQFWKNLRSGVESIESASEEELLEAGYNRADLEMSDVVRASASLDDIELFDADFFGFNRREAELTDPQHRLLLECSWEALENAAYDPSTYDGLIGMFAGASFNTYLLNQLASRLDLVEAMGEASVRMGNCGNFLATKVSYKLNLKGPSVSVQTACSTSLVALHMAWQSLLNGECDLALAGGSSVSVPQKSCYRYREGGIYSPDGHCRAFDERAAGTVGGNGVGVVLLKRLADALADRDTVYAVVKGSAINNDGSGKIGYTAPSISGQAEVIAEALAVAGCEAEDIDFVEAHGTGTPLGDPIEVNALTRVYRATTDKRGYCAIGSVKSNIGHLDIASGVAGVIKAVLAMRHGEIPPSLHFERPNPKCDFENSPFFVAGERIPLPEQNRPWRCGVTSLGIGGTNAHVILEQGPPVVECAEPTRSQQLLVLSAPTATALEARRDQLRAELERRPSWTLADVAYTCQVGREAFKHRMAVVCDDLEDAVLALGPEGETRRRTDQQEVSDRPVAFLFPGQGGQSSVMGHELYGTEPRYREAVDRCCKLLEPHLGWDLREVLVPHAGTSDSEQRLASTAVAQPALFVVEYALAQLWQAWGVRPSALIGHSLGEYVAACLAGVFSLADALAVVATRGRLMAELEPGAMLAVSLGEEEAQAVVAEPLALAALNAPGRSVISGPEEAIAQLAEKLAGQGVPCRRLATSHAFHSSMMDPVLEPFTDLLRQVELSPPSIPCLSNVTGTWLSEDEATDPEYWARHLRSTVRFGPGIEVLLEEPERLLLEVGPGRALTSLAIQGRGAAIQRIAIPSSGSGKESARLLDALGRLWLAGLPVEWPATHDEPRRRLALPTYPFERQRYWVDLPSPEETEETTVPETTVPEGLEVAAASAEPSPTPSSAPPASSSASPASPSAPSAPSSHEDRRTTIDRSLDEIIHGLVGVTGTELDRGSSFVEIGVDSLLLIQFSQKIEERFGLKISMVRLLDEINSLEAVAGYLERELPPEALPVPVVRLDAESAEPAPETGAEGDGVVVSSSRLEQLMERQVALLERLEARLDASPTQPAPPAAPITTPSVTAPTITSVPSAGGRRPSAPPRSGLEPEQQQHFESLVERYVARTQESKRRTDAQRRDLADNRASVGFRMLFKEMTYPIIGEGSNGARLRDVDGNEYVDVTMGFGVHLFGHSPPFVLAAVREQLERGVQLGPQSELAGEVARRIVELTGVERVAFANTGSEAIMTAVRVARATTRRARIALFAGSYHGSFDGILAQGMSLGVDRQATPWGPGIPPSMVADVTVLPYGDDSAFETLREIGDELAAVLVEPVQSRHPDLQPRDFLSRLRAFTEQVGAALIFDEVVTGFRSHPGGVQALFGIEADLVTYGKVLGGGMPLGVIAGKAAYMDTLDGGSWCFGDASYPEVDKTFFAGTFCKHPLTMTAARAVLRHLAEAGPELQERLNQRTAELVRRLNTWFEREGMPIQVVHFGSLFIFQFAPEFRYDDLFFFHLIDQGIFVWEGRTCYLSTAHTDDDVERIIQAVRASAEALRSGGFLPSRYTLPAPAPSPSEPRTLPMTTGQEQLWILSQLGEATSRAYNQAMILDIGGELRVDLLARALGQLVDRHDSLRVSFPAEGKVQRIAPALHVALPQLDLTALAEDARRRERQRIAADTASRIFDFERTPLLRARVLKIAEREHALVLANHHIVIDGRSSDVILSELFELYDAACAGVEPGLPPATRLEERQAQQPEPGPALDYWVEQFADSVPVLELPADHPRPALFTYRGGRRTYDIGPDLPNRLKHLSAEHSTTFFVTLLAGFCALLHRLSGQDDLVVGIPAADPRGDRPFVGYELNLLPIRSRLSADTRFAQLLTEIRGRVLGGYEHREVPLPTLVRRLELPPDFSRPPLVSVLFNLDRAERQSRFADLDLKLTNQSTGGARLELFLDVADDGSSLHFECESYRDLYADTTVDRWLRHYRVLLEAIAEDPELRVSELPLLRQIERQQLLWDWRARPTSDLVDVTVHRRIRQRAERDGEAIAIATAETALSYAELSRQVQRLAGQLRRLELKAEAPVGIFLERSPELAIAMLAVLEAGAAYIPLDPAYPEERLSMILDDALAGAPGGGLVLSVEALQQRLPTPGVRVLCLDSEVGRDSGEARSSETEEIQGKGAVREPSPTQLAYTIYTSGSTGRPKGVAIPHRALANFLHSMAEEPGFPPRGRMLALTSPAFDISGLELFLPLLEGGTVRPVSAEEASDGQRLREILASERVAMVQATPASWRLLLAAGWTGDPRLVALCGGEALPRELANQLVATTGELWNLYGPTETTIWSTRSPILGVGDEPISLGRPIAETDLSILGRRLAPAPLGIPGELMIGGAGLARGYRGRPDLSAERFVPHPAAESPGARAYRTGDLARIRSEGGLEFLGRIDQQVKVRGFRIELGEVEGTLLKHPAVAAAAVAVDEESEERRLVAYIVARAGATPAVEQLRDWLARSLPAYMVPAVFLTLDALPRTPSGKVDRRALARVEGQHSRLGQVYVAPRSELERTLAEIWRDLLEAPKVGIHDSFFELGGQSLELLRARTRLAELGWQIAPAELFQYPTIGALAEHLSRDRQATEEQERREEEQISRLKHGRARLQQRLVKRQQS